MKKHVKNIIGFWFVVAYCLLSVCGLAEMGTQLSGAAAKVFTEPRWEGYEPAVVSGYGDQDSWTGQYAVLMKKGEHNVLCIVEKGAQEAEFVITVETDKAVYQGDRLPSLLIDTGGDALYYSYQYDEGPVIAERLSVFKVNGAWGNVSPTLFLEQEEGRYPETYFYVNRNVLTIDTLWADGNDNIVERGDAQRIKGVPIELFAVDVFDINNMPKDYESAVAQYGGEPYASTLLYSKQLVMGENMPAIQFELWGLEGEPRMMDAVRISTGGTLQQEIPIGLELYSPPESAVLFADANFDGYMDFLINRSTGSYNAYYDYWIWDTQANQYSEFGLYSALEASPTFDAEAKQIHCFTKDGATHHFETIYQVREGLPEMLAQYELEYESELKRTVTLWQYVDNALTAVDKWTEDAPFPVQLGTQARGEQLFYYNNKGGTYYHRDPRCSTINSRYFPLQAIWEADLQAPPYSKLSPCKTCN